MKYKILLFRKERGNLSLIKSLTRKSLNSPIITIGSKKYVVDLEKPTYINKEYRYFFVDYDVGSQFNLNETAQALTPEELDMIIGNKIIKELTSGVMDNRKEKIMLIILGAIIGGLLVATIMMGVMNNKIEQLLTDNTGYPPIIPTTPLSLIKSIISLVLGGY